LPPLAPQMMNNAKVLQKQQSSKSQFGGESIWAQIAYNPYFENSTMAVIAFNAVWIGVDTEWNHEKLKQDGKLPLEPVSTVIENLFCIYFSVELAVRFLAFRSKRMCFFDAWFVFDSILVGCMILETWIMVIVEAVMASDSEGGVGPLSALRLLRLLRLARVGRLMRFVPELGKLVKGMVKAARSVIFILIFLVLVIYVFAIIFTGTLSDREKYPRTPYCTEEYLMDWNMTWKECLAPDFETPDGEPGEGEGLPMGEFGGLAQDLFATMGDSFMSLFTRGVLGDNLDETVVAILDASLVLMWLFFIFLIITFATLLNMLIGVVCDVISDAAAEEEEAETVNILTCTIQEAFEQIDTNEDGLVCKEEWHHIKDNKNVRKTLLHVGIEAERMEERLDQMESMLFDDEELDLAHKYAHDDPSNHTGKSGTTLERQGLTVQQLIQRVVEIRPDQNASALDLELLKAQVMKDQKTFKSKLKKIEEGVKKTLGPGATNGLDNMPDMPDMPAMPGMPDYLEEDEEEGRTIRLEDVPTSVLFQAIMEREKISGEEGDGSNEYGEAMQAPLPGMLMNNGQ